jgi:AraC family transcriptional regulator
MDVAFLPARSTYGKPVALRDFGGFAVSLGVHAPGETIPAHRHEDEYQWCVTLKGGFEETSGRQQEVCGAGSLLVRPPDCVHADKFDGQPGVCLNVFPHRSWLEAHGFGALNDAYRHGRSRGLFRRGRAVAREMQTADSSAALAVEGLLVEMLGSLLRLETLTRDGHSRWLAVAVDEIESNPGATLRLQDLARSAGVSAGHLARAFRAGFGLSVGEYVRERRLQRAATLMRDPRLALAEVAAAVGFYDQAHFSRAFRARFGATPATFRQTMGR